MADPIGSLKTTPLTDLHRQLGARMVAFAGYDMPVQFEGVKGEHLWTRTHAGLFDVSHMGPCFLTLNDTSLTGDAAHAAISAIIERIVPSDIASLKPGQARLSVLLNADGGILDDLIITRPQDEKDQGTVYIVVNGAVKDADFALLQKTAGEAATLRRADDGNILIALQGPDAQAVAADHFPGQENLKFMRAHLNIEDEGFGAISRCGYTGEDGFEILMPADIGIETVQKLLADDRVRPIGLGARDTLRLEAGLCLYGHDIDAHRTPVEADLAWVIQKSRRERADFPGADRVLTQLADGPAERRVGIELIDRAPAREGTEIHKDGAPVGVVTSGGFAPSLNRPIAMGYVRADLSEPGTDISLMVRGQPRAARVAALPFIQPNYKR